MDTKATSSSPGRGRAGLNPTTDPSDIFARQFNAKGQATDDQFEVDQYVLGVQQPGVQNQSRVAMSPDGTFVVTWTSSPISISNTNTGNAAIFAREYTSLGVPFGKKSRSTLLRPTQTASRTWQWTATRIS